MSDYINLGGLWQMRQCGTDVWHEAPVPGSVYDALLRDGTMQDPFWRDNELAAFELMKQDYEFTRTFDVPEDVLAHEHICLVCRGLDTLAHVTLNGVHIADTANMHITWEWDVKPLLVPVGNVLTIRFDSPINYCAEAAERAPGWESSDATPGFRHLRKAHCMFGWDWGPRLPDAGIWREIGLLCWNHARVKDVLIRQTHEEGRVSLTFTPEFEGTPDAWSAVVYLGKERITFAEVTDAASVTLDIPNPQLWWPAGYGEQPLYTVWVAASHDGQMTSMWMRNIGLRTLSISREKDEWGEEFCHIVNGVKIFAMGADYIPEDNLLSRVTPERTRRLLEDAKLANFNTIRIWGGGYYPDDSFYHICDELGLLVWQDLMYACAFYDLTSDFEASIRKETEQNVKRLRHHASLALICGNNEMEMFMGYANDNLVHHGGGFEPKNRRHVTDYVKMFEYILPGIVREHAPDTFWWPGSPSSGGDFDNPNDYNRGDTHYWDVWHGEKPFTEYRKFHFRYASEFGFQSFPCLKTVESFTEPGDRNIFSRVMERHQRNGAANGKIMSYLSATFRYPNNFDDLLYASQLLQADAIRYGVEHWRRHRGRCMGAIIWQLNDCWPVASWASIDYFGRWKAMHYAAKRFFAPVMLSAEEEGEMSQNPKINEYRTTPIERSIRLCVANESRQAVTGEVRWTLRTPGAAIVREGREMVTVQPLSSHWLDKAVFDDATLTGHYAAYEFVVNGEVVSEGTTLFCAPKHFDFADPALTATLEGEEIVLRASAFARQVWVESDDADMLLSDNAFDMNAGEKRVKVLRGSAKGLRVRSVYDLGR